MCYLQLVNSLINRIVILFTFQMKFKLFFLIKSLRIADFRRDFFENWFIFNFFAIKFRMTKLIFRNDKNKSCKYDFCFFRSRKMKFSIIHVVLNVIEELSLFEKKFKINNDSNEICFDDLFFRCEYSWFVTKNWCECSLMKTTLCCEC